MNPFKIFVGITLAILLTTLTQIGGLVFLMSILTHGYIDKRLDKILISSISKTLAFLTLYCVFTFVIIPLVAPLFGRVALPILEEGNLKPPHLLTCILNRNYVRPQLKEIALKVSDEINGKYPEAKVNYLDANFPFINKFPLFPHLSHNDGKKLDLSFQYNDNRTKQITNEVPSFIGYGICEEPRDGEENIPNYCKAKGFWQYNLLREKMPQGNKKDFEFDEDRTRDLVNNFARKDGIGRIFIEPHLKTRLNLTSEKIKFHGCHAVRHDDHIHVQLIN